MSYVIKAVLHNPPHPEYGQITIPFPIPDDQYDQTIEKLQAMDLGFSRNRECTVDDLDSYYGVLEPVLAEDEKSILRLTLTTSRGEYVLGLPASEGRWDAAKRALGAEDFAQATVSSAEFAAPQLKGLIPVGLITVEEAQALAECLQEIGQDHDGLMKYCSALAVEDPTTFSEALTIAMDIDDYERVPEDPAEYGRHNLRLAGAGDEILDMLNGYTDFEQLGRDIMKEECVRRTDFGLVRRLSEPFPQQETGQTMC